MVIVPLACPQPKITVTNGKADIFLLFNIYVERWMYEK